MFSFRVCADSPSCRQWLGDLQRRELSLPSNRWSKRQCHADLLGASRGADAGLGAPRAFCTCVFPSVVCREVLLAPWGNKSGSSDAISKLDGLTFLFLWSIDQFYRFLKMFLVLSEGEVVFLLLASACLSHIHVKYAQFLMRFFKIIGSFICSQ